MEELKVCQLAILQTSMTSDLMWDNPTIVLPMGSLWHLLSSEASFTLVIAVIEGFSDCA